MSSKEPVEIFVTVIFESHEGENMMGAILVDVGDLEVWIPKSLLGEWPEVGESGKILVPEWLAIEEGLV